MQAGYRLIADAPAVEDYLALRARAGLSPKSREQAVAGLPGSWAACHAIDDATGQTVGHGFVETAPDSVGMALELS